MARSRSHTRRKPRSNPRGVLSVAPDGFGFVQTAEGMFFVPAHKMGGAFDGDLVEVAPAHVNYNGPQKTGARRSTGERPTARIVSVLQRAHEVLVGRYEVADPFGVVVPSDPRIPYDVFTMRADNPGIPDGSIVRVRISEFPTRRSACTGVVEEVIGSDDDPRMDIEAVIARHRLETRFSEGAQAEAAEARVASQDALAHGYRDITDRFVVTIDPVDAKDFDDALSVEPLADGRVRLGVHIADVSHYVPWDSSVDLDARRRATSVYLADRVVPMLPEELSNDVCSLVPGAARRALTADIVLDANGRVRDVDLYESVIVSKARLSYEQAQCFIDAGLAGEPLEDALAHAQLEDEPVGALPLTQALAEKVARTVRQLDRIAQQQAALRRRAGALDFDAVEAKVVLDAQGEARDVRLRTKTRATSCVEEAMILANECVASILHDVKMPCMYRVHDAPSPDALAGLVPILQELGYDGDVSMEAVVAGEPRALQAVLARAAGRAEEELVSSLMVRAMQRAVYKPRCSPHFGLATGAYCHFTSPIRRYPDIVVHRMVKAFLRGPGKTFSAQKEALGWLAEHSSKMERVAEAAARETQELKLVEYMGRYVGRELWGVVSGVANQGVYVRFPNTAEGLVPVRTLGPEYFALDPVMQTLTGQDSGRAFRLGQKLLVRVHAAPAHARKLDLRLARR